MGPGLMALALSCLTLGATPPTAPPVALVTTAPGVGSSSWWLVDANGRRQLGSFAHLDDGSVRAALYDGHTLVATAPATPSRDRSFDGGLWRLDPDGSARLLCTGVAHASSPLVHDGKLFVARGVPGPATADTLRVDALTVDEIEPNGGSARTRLRLDGYLLHLCGALDDALYVYRLGPGLADIVSLDLSSGNVHSIVNIEPFARDFSVDRAGRRLLFRGRHASDARRWTVEAVALDSGARTVLYSGGEFSLAPHAWPGGVAYNPGQGGLKLLGAADPVRAPLGPGVDLVRGFSNDGRHVALLHTEEGRLPLAGVVDRVSGSVQRLDVQSGVNIAIAGFSEAGSAGRDGR